MLTSEQISEIDDVVRQIYADGYYTHLWEQIWKTLPGPLATLEAPVAYKVFQDFWDALPDVSSIRRGPFFAVCDMAEKYCLMLADGYEDVGELPDEDAAF